MSFPHQGLSQLSDFATISAGISSTRLKSGPGGGASLRVISLADVDVELPSLDRLGLATATPEAAQRFFVQTDDVIVTTRGADIRAAVVPETHSGVIAGANLAIIRPHGSLLPVLIAAFLRQPRTQGILLSWTAGASTPGFTIKALCELPIRAPSWERQHRLAELVLAMQAYRQAAIRALRLRAAATARVIEDELEP